MTTIKSRLFSIFIFIIFILSEYTASAQYTDTRMRLSAEADKDITNDLNISIAAEYRLKNNISVFDKTFIETGLSYDLPCDFRIGVSYRLMINQVNSSINQNRDRASAYIRFEHDIDDFEITYKTLLQYGFDDLNSFTGYNANKFLNRTSITINYNWFGVPISPFIKYELFTHLNNTSGVIINQWKLRSGFDYRLSSKSDISVHYTFENEFNVKNPIDAHVVQIGYSYSF